MHSDTLTNYLKKTYHEQYFNSLFGTAEQHSVIHETHREPLTHPVAFFLDKGSEHLFQISWLDRYLFHDGLCIFCFNVEPQAGGTPSFEDVSTLIRQFRNSDCTLQLADGGTVSLSELIVKHLSPGLSLSKYWDKHLNRLKHYTVVNDKVEKTISQKLEQTLFEFAHAMPLGAVRSQSNESPTEEYYQKVFREQSIEVYANWKAIALLDSFTRLSVQFEDVYHSWELDYFHIYVYCLHIKYRLQQLNESFPSDRKRVADIAKWKETFLSYATSFSSNSISHKFLPNLIYEKIRKALEIDSDIDALEKRYNRLPATPEHVPVDAQNSVKASKSSIPSSFLVDVYVSFREQDNRTGWVTQFGKDLTNELNSLLKNPVSVSLGPGGTPETEKALVLVPVLSPGYCHADGREWNESLLPFKKAAQNGPYGLDIRLRDSNVSSRIIPVCIYELEETDRNLYHQSVGSPLRAIDFIYREPGINRPLEPEDVSPDGKTRNSYRNQVNRTALAIREVMRAMKDMSLSN